MFLQFYFISFNFCLCCDEKLGNIYENRTNNCFKSEFYILREKIGSSIISLLAVQNMLV